jgi:short subunit dehydrogenase-like uncharacterized protein
MANGFLLYGATGYTGRLIARQAVEQGLRPVLAGRSAEKVQRLASELGLQATSFALDDPAALEHALEPVSLVLHCAGPYAHTAMPMVDACLRTRTHYVDLTGEIRVFQAIARRDAAARFAGSMLLPGAGFDVVALDCLAAHLKARLPRATRIGLAVKPVGSFRPTHGTAATIVEGMRTGRLARRGGTLVRAPLGSVSRPVDFGDGLTRVIGAPLSEVFTVFVSTGIPDVDVYVGAQGAAGWVLSAARTAAPLLALDPVQRLFKRGVQLLPSGPSEQERQRTAMLLWGEVRDGDGNFRVSHMKAPNAYAFTARSALAVVRNVLAGNAPPGFQTPSLAYRADFVLQIQGVARSDQD